MRQFLFTSLFVLCTGSLFGSQAYAQECKDLQIDGTWKMANQPSFFSKIWRTYQITQDGCYVLIYDTYRKATWKVDLSGETKIHVPKEMVEANLHGGGPSAAQNMANLEVSLKPANRFPTDTSFTGNLTAEPFLEAQKSFPISMKAHFGAQLYVDAPAPTGFCPPYCETPVRRIQMKLTEFQILDITKGLPSNVDKNSFLSGINMVTRMFVSAFSYKLTLLDLVKDR